MLTARWQHREPDRLIAIKRDLLIDTAARGGRDEVLRIARSALDRQSRI
jgi:hypothetical protein